MTIGSILTRKQLRPARLTNQNIADLMLQADRDRRAALARGEHTEAALFDLELDKLEGMLQ